jgi:hypothetical protein
MKTSFVSTFLLLFILACNQTSTHSSPSEDAKNIDPFEGVWELTHQYWTTEWDTFYADTLIMQHKIYLDGYVMWTADPAPDSTDWHGYGTYRLSNDTIIETLLSMSLPMRQNMNPGEDAILKVVYDENHFKQAIQGVFNDTVFYAIEEWKRIN